MVLHYSLARQLNFPHSLIFGGTPFSPPNFVMVSEYFFVARETKMARSGIGNDAFTPLSLFALRLTVCSLFASIDLFYRQRDPFEKEKH